MSAIIVVNNPAQWTFDIPDVVAVSASDYLTDVAFSNLKGIRIYNLCRSYRYQSHGYYVSLLAAARGHKPVPSVTTINDMKSPSVIRVISDEIEKLIQKSLSHIHGTKFTLSIYFGKNVAKHYDKLCSHLNKLFEAPFLRAYFVRNDSAWHLQNISPISLNEVPLEHYDFITNTARQYFAGKRISVPKRKNSRFDLAILHNPNDPSAPSDKRAIGHFRRAAESMAISTELITKDDYSELPQFDALFIRETTAVNHHTYRFARRAEAEGLVVVDDPLSILRCTNKVYINELLTKNRIPTPPTVVIHKGNLRTVPALLSYPLILKQPDGSSSQGVEKTENLQEFTTAVERFLDKSALIIGQTYMPTDFDWRVGIFDHQPLYVCKYYMASKHWQIIKTDKVTGRKEEGKYETLTVEDAPAAVVKLALRVAKLIGNGFYGVDIKQVGKRLVVIEINDNPSIDAGVEDAVLKKELYVRIMRIFLKRLEIRKGI